jgi:hypothetical protein
VGGRGARFAGSDGEVRRAAAPRSGLPRPTLPFQAKPDSPGLDSPSPTSACGRLLRAGSDNVHIYDDDRIVKILPAAWLAFLCVVGCTGANQCDSGTCLGNDGTCYGPCSGSAVCTTAPSGSCSAPSPGGVSCCTAGGGGSGCTSQVCCGGLYECNGACYSSCTVGSQPCCTQLSCVCFRPCC